MCSSSSWAFYEPGFDGMNSSLGDFFFFYVLKPSLRKEEKREREGKGGKTGKKIKGKNKKIQKKRRKCLVQIAFGKLLNVLTFLKKNSF